MINCNLSPIPFYESLEQQDFRLWYAFGDKYPFFVPGDYLIPFFINIPRTGLVLDSIRLFRGCCSEQEAEPSIIPRSYNMDFSNGWLRTMTATLDYLMQSNGLTLTESEGNTILTYFAAPIKPLNLEKGVYYMKVIFKDGTEYYSDIFFVDTDITRLLKIEWYNQTSLPFEGGIIPYSQYFHAEDTDYYYKNIVYLDATIGKPEYKFTEEGEERDGYFFAIKQISEKTFKFGFIAPEWLCDCMRLIRLSDRVKITNNLEYWENGARISIHPQIYQCDTFLMEVDWNEQGHYAGVSCEFDTDTVVKLTGKAYSTFNDR